MSLGYELLVDSNRIPEAALMARSYLPSKVSEIVALWRKDLNKINQKAAESLADPEEYPNLFEDWQIALDVESRVAETLGNYPPAAEYVQHIDRSTASLVETFRNMQMHEEEPLENGSLDHEVAEQNGEEAQEVGEDDAEEEGHEEGQEEAVVVDADLTDVAFFLLCLHHVTRFTHDSWNLLIVRLLKVFYRRSSDIAWCHFVAQVILSLNAL
ncbi:unnamed protein product [Fraxinus pennsylvanica]|uniref:COPA/B TPR domain-containing protein n=1 Tax=Fraxinus pennsylvanica TaxID=56036 RepID=A0AAD1ZH64_9LAMI|nr:unnamed protein product [Fraxinus pennsylvanica]